MRLKEHLFTALNALRSANNNRTGFGALKTRAKRGPTKIDSFKRLNRLGIPVGSVLDVGVQTCTNELIVSYRDKPHLLMEPVTEFEEHIHRIYKHAGVDYEYLPVAVSNSDGEVVMKTKSVFDGGEITHARMTEEVDTGKDFRTVPMRKLDSIIAERSLPKPYLLKIDVDGAELSVLEGAEKTLADCSIICIEAGIRNFHERTNAIMKMGFQAFDIVDFCYYDDLLVQTDMIFLNSAVAKAEGFDYYRDGFNIEKWASYQP